MHKITFLFISSLLLLSNNIAGAVQLIKSYPVADSLTREEILNLNYPDNPVTHQDIKFTNGLFEKPIPGSNKVLKIKIEKDYSSGILTENNLPGLAAIITTDSGNGIKYYYLVAFLKVNGAASPAAFQLLDSNIVIDKLNIEENNIGIWWLHRLEGDSWEDPSRIICRNFEVRNDSLVDDEYDERANDKLALQNDTIFTDSARTGFWTVKWNKTHAAVFFNLTGEGEGIYEERHEDIDDSFYAGDSIEHYFNPDWYYNTSYEMLSVVGPYVSFLSSYEGSGGVHPIVGTTLDIYEINAREKYNPSAPDTATVADPMKIMEEVKNHKESGERRPVITDIFPEQEVFKALMKDSLIQESLKGNKPVNLKQLVPELDGDCAIDFTYLLESFAFKSINNDSVVVEFGLTHGCEVAKGTFTIIDITLPIPENSRKMFLEAAKNKSTIEEINSGFIESEKQEAIEKKLAWEEFKREEDSIKVSEERQKEFNDHYQRGKDYLNDQGKYKEAIMEFTKALSINSLDIETIYQRAMAYINSQDFYNCIIDCNKLLELNPNYASGYYLRAISLSHTKRDDKAIADYTKAIELDSSMSRSDYLTKRGQSYIDLKNYDKAISDLNNAINIYQQNSEAYFLRGAVSAIKKEYEKAILDYNKAIEYDTTKISAYFYCGRGESYSAQKRYDDAISDYNTAIKIDNDLRQAFFDKAVVYYNQEKYEMALSEYNKFLKLSPNNKLAYDNIGYVYLRTGNYEEAISSFNKCIEIDTSSFDAILGLAISYYYKNDSAQAVYYLNQAISVQSKLKEGMKGINILKEEGYYYNNKDIEVLKILFDIAKIKN
jgi:tetratricopeptide (TPR) repeat protein